MYLNEHKHNWGLREFKAQAAVFNRFMANVSITTIDQITKGDAVSFKQYLMAQNLSITTVNKSIVKLTALFNFIHSHYGFTNIFDGLKIRNRQQKNKREAYTKEQIKQVVSFAHKKIPRIKWPLLLSIYTGARAGEVTQLYKQDIIKVDGVWVVKIQAAQHDQRLKTGNSQRIIPIHSDLIAAGFLDFVQNREEGRLFPEYKFYETTGCGKHYVGWFIKNRPVEGRTLHELRHTIATRLKENNTSLQVAAAILGHTTSSMTFETYGSSAAMPVELLKEAIEGIRYE